MTSNHDSHALHIDIDAAITQVAREMTAAEPATDIRARVLGRLGDRPSGSLWRWAPLLTFAASLAILAGTWTLWPRAAPPTAPAPVTLARTEPAGPASEHALQTAAPALRVQRVSVANRPAPEVMSEAERAWHERAVPALAGPTALAIDPIEHTGTTIAPIEIQPLVTEPLLIKSIGAGREILK